MKKCYCCGAKIEQDNAAFCPKCGKPLEVTAELTRRAAAGDSDAQTELYYRTYAAVYARIRSKVPDDDTAMDLMQDTYLRAFSHLEQLKEPAAFPGWILTIARNLTINWYKKHSKEKTTALFSESEFENKANLSAEDDESASTEYRIDFMPEESLDRAETARLVSEILDELPEEQKIVLLMRYTDEMSIEEISEELGVSPNTVKTRLLRAKKKVEAKVLELERKGTKLYSLAPLPFLLFLLGNLESQAPNISATHVLGTGAAAGASAGATAGTTATTTAATSAGTTAATTAAATAGGVATKGLAVKIIAALLAVALVGGGGAAAYSAYSQAKQAEEDARAAEMLAEEEAQRQAEEEAQRLAEEAEAEAAEEVVQVTPPTAEVMEEMLGLVPRSIMTNCITMTGTVTANQAVELAAFAIRENRNSEDTVWADGWELLPTESLEKYLQDLFGSSYEMSDYSGNSNYFTVDSTGQMYISGFDYSCEATTSIANISNTASEDGGFDVLARYQSTEEGTVTGEKYVLYHVIPDDVSDYGWVIVSMIETDETGTVIEGDTETAVSTDLEWAELYADSLEAAETTLDGFSGDGDFYLVYVNDDDVPEMIYQKYYGYENSFLFYIQDGKLKANGKYEYYSVGAEYEGYLLSEGGKTGGYSDILLYLSDECELTVIFSGYYEDYMGADGYVDFHNYTCNGESVTATEYYQLLAEACTGCSWITVESNRYSINTENSREYEYFSGVDAMISYLRSLTN